MDFDTTRDGSRGSDRNRRGTGGGLSFDTARHPPEGTGVEGADFKIPPSSRKAALVNLAVEVWRKGLLDPKELGEVRGRDVDEAGFRRALYRSSMGEIEYILRPAVKGRSVVVEGRLAGTGRTSLERLGVSVEEIRPDDEERYVDMTPVVFVLAAVAMAARYISLGLDDQDLYILSGIFFALMYGLRPFLYKLQRPRDQ